MIANYDFLIIVGIQIVSIFWLIACAMKCRQHFFVNRKARWIAKTTVCWGMPHSFCYSPYMDNVFYVTPTFPTRIIPTILGFHLTVCLYYICRLVSQQCLFFLKDRRSEGSKCSRKTKQLWDDTTSQQLLFKSNYKWRKNHLSENCSCNALFTVEEAGIYLIRRSTALYSGAGESTIAHLFQVPSWTRHKDVSCI